MHRLVTTAVFAAACYAPSASPGAPCGPNGECPSGLECRSGVCTVPGATDDALDPDNPVMVDAAIDGPSFTWSTPVLLTTLESPGDGESDPSVTADKLTVVFQADTAVDDSDIYIGKRAAVTDSFSIALVPELNSAGFNDESPEISADGQTVYFRSRRSGAGEIYTSTFSTTWSAPALATDLSSTSEDGDLAISPDGLTAVVVREVGPNRFYFYTRASTSASFGGATVHTELNVTSDIAAPTITNGGDIIYFHAGASRDLYRSTLKGNGSYTMPAPVTELNTTMRDAAPFVSQTDDYMIFERAGDLYETTR